MATVFAPPFSPPSAATTPYPHDFGCFPSLTDPPPPISPGEWTTGSLSATAPASASSPTGADGGSEQTDPKPKKKRGRPRIYQDDGVERPKRKPGRPPTYTIGPESLGSMSPPPLIRSSSSAATVTPISLAISNSGSGSSRSTNTANSSASSLGGAAVSKGRKGKEKEKCTTTAVDEDDDDAKRASMRARNKTAATRYRAKTQAAIADMEAREREVNLQRQALIACAGQLRDEVLYLKNEVLRHATCGCPLIEGYVSEAARRTTTLFAHQENQQSPLGGISSGMDGMSLDMGMPDTMHVAHVEGCLGGRTDGS